jgi:integrase
MADNPVPWKKITHGLPRGKKYADDRIPTVEEIRKLVEYPDRRIKAIVYTMASSGIRVGAWDYLKWGHIRPIKRDGQVIAAKMIVYAGEDEEYFTFISPKALKALQEWMNVVVPKAWIGEEAIVTLKEKESKDKGKKK